MCPEVPRIACGLGADHGDAVTISETDFHALVSRRAQRLLSLVGFVSDCSCEQILIRPLLGELHSEALELEELLDSYDARNNCRWCRLRALTAALKLFSDVSYELLHIKHALPAYRLLPIERDFTEATRQTLEFTGGVLTRASKQMLTEARQLHLPIPDRHQRESSFCEPLPPGRLARDCRAHRTETVSGMVTLLATAFLNLASDSKDVRAAGRARSDEYASVLADAVGEERLRSLELRFHNLQSQYDTYVAGTLSEREDPDLLVLRGHISVVFHLFATATMFAHYYERHASNQKPCERAAEYDPMLDRDMLVRALMTYSIAYIHLYTRCAEQLCREMLKRYAEVGRIELPIPRYRGFHVRPATLVSRLVLHYGSDVKMTLDNDCYDASKPLDLFRANEKINAMKRRRLASLVVDARMIPDQAPGQDFEATVRGIVSTLAEQGQAILYERPIQFPQEPAQKEGTLEERVIAELSRLLILGKIDVDCQLKAAFVGDTRVLVDIELLAQSGYGEDEFGNNVLLPEKLRYLRA